MLCTPARQRRLKLSYYYLNTNYRIYDANPNVRSTPIRDGFPDQQAEDSQPWEYLSAQLWSMLLFNYRALEPHVNQNMQQIIA